MSQVAIQRKIGQVSVPQASSSARTLPPWGFPEFFIISQTVLPALLYLPGTQPIRVPIRVAAYGLSLIALAIWAAKRRAGAIPKHPSRAWLVAAISYLVFMIVHPTTNTILAGCAQVMLYLSVLAPVIWVPDLVKRPEHLHRLIWILLLCSAANCTVGLLQVYDPERWMPKELTSNYSEETLGALTYKGVDGRVIVRPPGLSDNPGAVCGPGMLAATIGLIIALGSGAIWKRVVALAISFIGVSAIYFSQVRTSILIAAGMLITYGIILILQRERFKAAIFLGAVAAIFAAAFAYAVSLGGAAVAERFSTLIEDDPSMVYYKAGRGGQMQYDVAFYLSNYPLGAGLARWGMMRHYFGDEDNQDSRPFWAELQLPAWALDGGLVLMLTYGVALVITTVSEFRLTLRHPAKSTRSLAAIVFVCNFGVVALIFGFAPFTTPVGLQYWFLAGAIHGVANARRGQLQ